MASLGTISFGLLIQVGDGEPVKVGTATLPLKAYFDGNELRVNISEAVQHVREALAEVLAPTGENTEDVTA